VQWLDGGAEANPDIIGVGPSDNAAVVGNLFYDFDRTWTSRDEGPDFFGSNALFLPDDRAARLGSASYQYLAAGAMAEGAVRRFLVLTNAVRDPGFVDPGGGVYLLRADSPVAGLVDGLHVPGIQEERDVGYLSALPRVVATDGENLLLNPGAETATTDGWELLAGGPAARFDAAANAEVAGTTVEPRSGAHLFRVGGTAAGEPARVSQGGIALSPAAAERIDAGSAVFELLVPFATGERGTGTGLTIQVSFESGDTPGVPLPGIRVGGGYGNAWFSPGRFRTAAFHGLVPPGARRAGVDLFLHAGPGGSFEAALDDVSFSLLGE
jgi:hypothetical protein